TLESLRAAAYDSYLTWFAEQLPALIQAYDSLPAGDSLKTKVAAPIEQLRNWDLRWNATSIATSVAVFWGERLGDRSGRGAVHAKAVTAGGESGHPDSPHFNDEAARYAAGNLRDVYFYRSQLKGHTEREYHPGN